MRASQVYVYMTPGPHTIGCDQPLALARDRMREHGIRHLPVLDGGVLVGIVTDRDIHLVESMSDVDLKTTLVEEAMTQEPYFVAPDTPLADVVTEMAAHKYGAAVVVDKGNVVGVFSVVDALRAFAERLRHDASAAPRSSRPTPG